MGCNIMAKHGENYMPYMMHSASHHSMCESSLSCNDNWLPKHGIIHASI